MDKTPPMKILWLNWCYETHVSVFSSFSMYMLVSIEIKKTCPLKGGHLWMGNVAVGAMLQLDGISCHPARNGNVQLCQGLSNVWKTANSLWPAHCRQHVLHKAGHRGLHSQASCMAVLLGPGPTLCINLLHPVCLSQESSLFVFSSWQYYRFWCVFYFNKSTLCLNLLEQDIWKTKRRYNYIPVF